MTRGGMLWPLLGVFLCFLQHNAVAQVSIEAVRSRAALSLSGGAAVPVPAVGRSEGLRAASLLLEVHEAAKRGHAPLSYGDAKSAMFSYTDNLEWDGTRGVWASYSEIFVPGTSGSGSSYRERGDQNEDGFVDSGGMNAEHTWPQSFFKKRGPMKSDLHHLMPTFMHVNSVRGRLPFGPVSGWDADYATNSGARRGAGSFEPPDSAKGRVARAMLYFYTRYLGTNILPRDFVESFWNSRVELFLAWNRRYPPSAFERWRNDRVAEVQGNRNPFVDDPSLADAIGADAFRLSAGFSTYAKASVRPIH
jgi:hypothetical protein